MVVWTYVCVDGLWVNRGFLTGLNAESAFLRVEATAGTSVPITFGGIAAYATQLSE